MNKIQCGGLIVKHGVALIEVLGFEWAPGEACGILCEFGDAGIPLSYINISNTTGAINIIKAIKGFARSKLDI